MVEDREDLLEHYRRTRAELQAAIDGLSDEMLSERSLDGWAVKDHLVHLALWDELRSQEIERISAGNDSIWRMSEAQVEAYNALAHELRLNVSPGQAKWELTSSRQRLLDAIASATERGLDSSLYGEAGLRSSHEIEHAGWIKRWRGERGI
jgi:uncharacterized damage-inducible protein DinB